MASSNQLRARVPDEQMEHMQDYAQEQDIRETDAERAIFEEGLIRLGYLEDHDTQAEERDASEMLLEGARLSGVLLGLVGFALVGFSVFNAQVFGYVGFGTLLAGFAAIAGAEFAPWVQGRITEQEHESGEPA